MTPHCLLSHAAASLAGVVAQSKFSPSSFGGCGSNMLSSISFFEPKIHAESFFMSNMFVLLDGLWDIMLAARQTQLNVLRPETPSMIRHARPNPKQHNCAMG
eukprot:2600658-Amphidinium_carterae.1